MNDRDEDDFSSEDPIVRALRAPGTAEELARENEFLAAFAAQRPQGSVRRIFGRVGVGATTAVAAVAFSTGVAAAYTGGLPDPVQEFAHNVLGPVGVPDPEPVRPPVTARAPEKTASPTAAPTTTAPDPTLSPSAEGTQPAKPTAQPTKVPALVPTPTATNGVPTPSATPTAGATTPPVRRVPAALSVVVSDTRVPADTAVSVSGVVTAADGHLLRQRTVRLMARAGTKKWTQVATAKTDKKGRVLLVSPALTRTTQLRLATANKVRSASVRVVVVPVVTAGASTQDGTTTITVSVRGARAGDTVVVLGRRAGKNVRLGQAKLGADGTAEVTVPTPRKKSRVVVRVLTTKQHPSAQTSLHIGATPE